MNNDRAQAELLTSPERANGFLDGRALNDDRENGAGSVKFNHLTKE